MFKSLHKYMLLVVFVIFSLAGCKQKPAQKPAAEKKTVVPEVSIKETVALKVVYLEEKGPYSETGKSMQKLFSLMTKKNLKPSGPPMGIFYDNPEVVKPEETRYEVLSPFIGEFKGDNELKVKELPAQKVAVIIYKGPYEKSATAYKKLFDWLAKNNYAPAGAPMEKYLTLPSQVAPPELKTEILIPVKPKTQGK